MNNGKILIIDSGLGGLSYYQAILSSLITLPKNIYLDYLADNKAFPYGAKNNKELTEHLTYVARSLAVLPNKYDFIVIACNTASLYGYTIFTQFFHEKQIVITTPDLYMQAHPEHGPFLLIATSATCRAYQNSSSLLLLPADDLVTWIEKKQHTLSYEEQLSYLQAFWEAHLTSFTHGTIILGCTHFLHIKTFLQLFAGNNIHIVDTTISVAQDLKQRIVAEENQFVTGNVTGGTLYLTQYSHEEDESYYKKIAGEYGFEFNNEGLL